MAERMWIGYAEVPLDEVAKSLAYATNSDRAEIELQETALRRASGMCPGQSIASLMTERKLADARETIGILECRLNDVRDKIDNEIRYMREERSRSGAPIAHLQDMLSGIEALQALRKRLFGEYLEGAAPQTAGPHVRLDIKNGKVESIDKAQCAKVDVIRGFDPTERIREKLDARIRRVRRDAGKAPGVVQTWRISELQELRLECFGAALSDVCPSCNRELPEGK